MKYPEKISVDDKPSDTIQYYIGETTSAEQGDTWFLGSLINSKKISIHDYQQIAILHNQITNGETSFTERYQSNKWIAAKLAEYFPLKWLVEITTIFRKMDNKTLGIKTNEDRVCVYLVYIELYLTFRGLMLHNFILNEINTSLGINISKDNIKKWKIKILRIVPAIRNEWVRIREQVHQKAFFSVLVQVINNELSLAGCTREEVFQIKQVAFKMAKKFIIASKGKYIKKPEDWARTICLKALRSIHSCYSGHPFPTLSNDALKMIENKRWQLDQVINSTKIPLSY